MQRKWVVVAGTMAACFALAAGLSLADDDEEKSPLHKAMEKIQSNYVTITKSTRKAEAYKKQGVAKKVAASAEEIVAKAKEAKPIKDAVKKAKDVEKADEKWDNFMDALIKNSQHLADVAGKPGSKYQDVKDAFTAVKKNCSDCHGVFRVDEDSFK